MKKISLLLCMLSFVIYTQAADDAFNPTFPLHGDDPETQNTAGGDSILTNHTTLDAIKSPNVIHYSYEKGDALYLATVDEFERPLSCILSINQERKYHFIPESGIISFERDTKVDRISVFHDAKVYDFIPDPTDHNKLTLVLDTESQRFDLFEDRLHKINQPITTPKNKVIKLVDNRHSYPNDLQQLDNSDVSYWGIGF